MRARVGRLGKMVKVRRARQKEALAAAAAGLCARTAAGHERRAATEANTCLLYEHCMRVWS
jgi:hypothetical protein